MTPRRPSPPTAPSVLALLAVLAALSLASVAPGQVGSKGGGTSEQPSDTPAAPAPAGRSRATARLEIGERVPDFTLEDRRSESHKLSSLRGEWIALVFAGRRESFPQLDSLARMLEPDNIRVVAVCVEKPQTLRRYQGKNSARLLTLADPTAEVTALFGLWDEVTRTPIPGWVLVTPEGVARVALLGHGLPNQDAHELMRYLATSEP